MNIPVSVFGLAAATTASPELADHRPDGVVVSDLNREILVACV